MVPVGAYDMKAMSVLALAAMAVAGVAQAQTMSISSVTGQPPAEQMTNQPAQAQAMVPVGPGGTFKDECGFRYNSRGDRIDAGGRILPPPLTPPGGQACR